MAEMIRFTIMMNWRMFLLVFFAAFIAGFILAMSTTGLNKQKKKKGFRNVILYGKTKEIDKKIYEDYKETRSIGNYSYLYDDTEHHATKKFH